MGDEAFDYVVVGSGSSGGALAARLAEDTRVRVLLLEAGVDDRWHWLRFPAGVIYLVRGERALWRFHTEPVPTLHGRSIFWPRGRVLGGSSGVNGMIWVRGDPREFDRWRDGHGLPGWGWSDLEPLYRRIERYAAGDPAVRGHDGPVTITEHGPRQPLMSQFIAACVQAGIPAAPDYNASAEGIGMLQFNVRDGLRCSQREAYLQPARGRPNLVVRTGARVHRVRFDGRRAAAIDYRRDGVMQQVRIGREAVLCAGAIQSPQLLELSGIGDPQVLARAGIPVLHALPAVGTNLRDHLYTRLTYECTDADTLNQLFPSLLGRARIALRFLAHRDGLLTACGQVAHALARTTPADPQPDVKIQLHWLSSQDARDPRRYVLDDYRGVTIGTFALRPRSQGTVHVAGPDPEAFPTIRGNYLDDPEDCRVTVSALRLARRVMSQPAIAASLVRETRPGPELDDDDGLLDWARRTGTTSYHPIGTCRMGGDADSVVDARLRVRGVDGLRVADCSVMPTMPSSNTHAPATLIGERAAQLIAEDARG